MSARDKLRQANIGSLDGGKPIAKSKNVVSDLLNNYEHTESTADPNNIDREIDVIAQNIPEPKKVGRPVEHNEPLKTISVRLTIDNYNFIKRNGWEYGGYTGYLNHLIEEKRGIK
ncbi:MAG: hypothetical protein J6W64_01940 [Bacilli bacterium]|nr:hypothetical protein [Bacilli bacterium]